MYCEAVGIVQQLTRPRPLLGRPGPSILDGVAGLALAAVGLAEASAGLVPGPPGLAAAVLVASLAPVVVRRVAPLAAMALAAAVYLPFVVAYGGANSLAELMAGLLYFHALGRWADARSLPAGTAVGALLVVVQGLRGSLSSTEDWAFALSFSVAALGVGIVQRRLSERARASAADADTARRERDAAARVAVEEERTRIARELHDVVAHAVGLMVLQAGGARAVLDHRPEEARHALQNIEETGRQGLAEMRRLVGILRGSDPGQREPLPGLAEIPVLADAARSGGLEVDLEIDGAVGTVPPGVQLAAYRLIQESLTNVRRHARATRVDISLSREPGGLCVVVEDDGSGAGPADERSGGGHGLPGMRERVRVYGGDLEVGPGGALGGWLVRARLPLEGEGR